MNDLTELTAAIDLSRRPGVGAARFVELMRRFATPSRALAHFCQELDRGLSHQSLQKSTTQANQQKTVEMLEAGEIFGFYYSGPNYPEALFDLSEPPPLLFAGAGKFPARMAAVVGARKMLNQTKELVGHTVRELAKAGYAIVSGGAAGVDALAHQIAIEEGAETIAVLGCGIDVVYPRQNADLFAAIRRNGFLVSELLCGALPQKSFFPTRNRIIAGLTELVVVIQAGETSGSLTTARWAQKLDRSLYVALPKAKNTAGVEWYGSLKLVDAGAKVVSGTDIFSF